MKNYTIEFSRYILYEKILDALEPLIQKLQLENISFSPSGDISDPETAESGMVYIRLENVDDSFDPEPVANEMKALLASMEENGQVEFGENSSFTEEILPNK